MAENLPIDLSVAHRALSARCFMETWDLIRKVGRTGADDELMIETCLASLWHWRQRPDCTQRNLSIGYWQASRVYALVGQAENALRYGQLCLEAAEGGEPYYSGYGHEAIARAAKVAGYDELAAEHVALAREFAAAVTAEDDRAVLLADLDGVAARTPS